MNSIELRKARGNSYYLTGKLSVGVYLNESNKSAILIDSGIDKDLAKKLDKAILQNGYQPTAIINTHSHADHCGGNHFFQKKYPDIQIYATRFETHFIEDPFLEPLCFCSGALPFQELRNKFLEAKPSKVTHVLKYEDHTLDIGGESFTVVTLPGHTQGMIGIISPDQVLYVGDAIFGEEILEKHGVLFYTDIAKTKDSLEKLETLNVKSYVLYHGGERLSLSDLVEEHLKLIEKTKDFILGQIVEHSPSLDFLVQQVMSRFNIGNNVVQHTLTSTVVRSYITELQQSGQVTLIVDNGLLKIHHSSRTIEP